jgi:hypothetical protein
VFSRRRRSAVFDKSFLSLFLDDATFLAMQNERTKIQLHVPACLGMPFAVTISPIYVLTGEFLCAVFFSILWL